MRSTNALEKLAASGINALVVFILSLPLLYFFGFGLMWKLSVIATFFIVEFVFFIFNRDRDLGMLLVGSRWKGRYFIREHFLYNILYTLSFSTLFFSIWFPFDLFLINIFLVQLPMVLMTGTTLHGYLTHLETVKA